MSCCSTGSAIFIGSDMDVSYTGVSVARSGAFLNAGTCTWTLYDADDVQVATGSLTYDSGSDGDYYGVIESTVTANLVENAAYYIIITFVEGGYNRQSRIDTRAAYES